MSGPLVFMMGRYAAELPTDRLYAKNHMWAQPPEEIPGFSAAATELSPTASGWAPPPTPVSTTWRFGFTAYAVRLLQDVYFLDWEVDVGARLTSGQKIGEIESSKAESELFAPLAGTLKEINRSLLADPSGINLDKYGAGWLLAIEGPGTALMTPQQYAEHLSAVWVVTQRTIKGQLND